jgi:hypothetical protein
MVNIWASIIGSVANIVDKATDVIFKERRQRARNEIDALELERKELMRFKPDIKMIKRVIAIDRRIEVLNSYLKNAEVK